MISVVIPAYNEEKFLPACLDSLAAQKTSREFEVIVVDNNSTDKTGEIARSYKTKILNLKVVLESKKGRGQARSTGFKHASGDLIFSTDADTILPSNWIESIAGVFEENPGIAAVVGSWRIEDYSTFKSALLHFIQPTAMRLYRLFFGHYWLNGFNFAIQKNAYEKSGGFSTILGAQEDVDLALRVSKIGKIKFLPHMRVITSGRRFKNGLSKELMSYVATFFRYRLLKSRSVDLNDPR